MLAFVMIFFLVPETKKKTLEELDFVFGVPTRTHIRYQITQVVPYWVKHHIMRQDAELESLYELEVEQPETGNTEPLRGTT